MIRNHTCINTCRVGWIVDTWIPYRLSPYRDFHTEIQRMSLEMTAKSPCDPTTSLCMRYHTIPIDVDLRPNIYE